MRSGGIARVAALALLWGSGFLWTKVALRGFTPEQTVVARLVLGALVLAVVVRLVGSHLPTGRTTWLHLTGAATFGNVIPYLLFAIGLQEVDSSVGGMLNATTPVWTVLIAVAANRQPRLPPAIVFGVVLGLCGTALIFAPWDSNSQFITRGALACLIGAVSYAISYVYIAHFLAGRTNSPLALSAGQLVAAAGLSLLIAVPVGDFNVPTWRTDAVVATIILGVLGTGAAYVLNYRIITDDGPVAASAVIYLLPAVAVALGVLVLNEDLALHALAGVAIVLVGVALTRRYGRQPAIGTGDQTPGL